MPSRSLASIALLVLPVFASSGGCIESGACTEIGCSSSAQVSYDAPVNEPYELTIDPNGTKVSAICLGDPSDEPQPPEWLSCDANGFTITGSEADLLTAISVTVVTVEAQEAVIGNVLVNLSTDEVSRPNGPDCEPTCYTRSGMVPMSPLP